ncbi:hypothetical protein KBD49_00420 [Myxococcota bacterium]|jgi:hypothetical protein|nr:hypothetical protein [Myxococcota bacterium]
MPVDERVTRPGAPDRWQRIVTYRPDDQGRVVARQDDGFEESRLVHEQAWEVIHRDSARAWEEVRAGRRSPLYFHMVANLMHPDDLAEHAGMWRWRVRRHLRPEVFRRLPRRVLERYAEVLGVTVEELQAIPDQPPPTSSPGEP